MQITDGTKAAFREGATAKRKGMPDFANPYDRDRAEFEGWMLGYHLHDTLPPVSSHDVAHSIMEVFEFVWRADRVEEHGEDCTIECEPVDVDDELSGIEHYDDPVSDVIVLVLENGQRFRIVIKPSL